MHSLVVTTMRQGQLETTRAGANGWPDVLKAIEQAASPCKVSLSDANSSPVLYLMLDHGRAHLSAWQPPDRCYYLMSKDSEATGAIYVGWDAYPAWSVVTDIDYALRAAQLFVEEHVLADWALWREEVVEL